MPRRLTSIEGEELNFIGNSAGQGSGGGGLMLINSSYKVMSECFINNTANYGGELYEITE